MVLLGVGHKTGHSGRNSFCEFSKACIYATYFWFSKNLYKMADVMINPFFFKKGTTSNRQPRGNLTEPLTAGGCNVYKVFSTEHMNLMEPYFYENINFYFSLKKSWPGLKGWVDRRCRQTTEFKFKMSYPVN